MPRSRPSSACTPSAPALRSPRSEAPSLSRKNLPRLPPNRRKRATNAGSAGVVMGRRDPADDDGTLMEHQPWKASPGSPQLVTVRRGHRNHVGRRPRLAAVVTRAGGGRVAGAHPQRGPSQVLPARRDGHRPRGHRLAAQQADRVARLRHRMGLEGNIPSSPLSVGASSVWAAVQNEPFRVR